MRLSPYLLQLLAITSGGSSRGALALSSTPMVMMAAVANEPQQQQKPLGGTKGETQLSSEVAVAVAGHQFMSCEETYGLGWETCGDRDSRFCYSPALGQSCCAIDNSYCDEGTWCAPVAGYCCLDSEDLSTCARNAGYEWPGNATRDELATTVTATLAMSETQTQLSTATLSKTLDTKSRSSWPENPSPPPPHTFHIRESRAARETRRSRTWMALGIGVLALLVLCC